MIISHAYKFVLLSPWKTASSTCHATLSIYDESHYLRFFYFNKYLNRVVHQHVTLAEYLSLPESRLGYFTAAFVRNPYDRAYSGFLQLQDDIAIQPKIVFEHSWIKDLVKAQIVENQKRIIEAEYDFNKWILALPEYEVLEVGRNTNMPLHPANYWTHLDGKQGVDFIGKVEDFDFDFRHFCNITGIDAPNIKSANVRDENGPAPTGRSGYKYLSKMSLPAIGRINELFKTDFELFGYEVVT
ncbi:MAG TPA: sulfotransferase family 2 domain-containing protein [Methylocystis sp.]|nr:sulfotransferase family 2 domain-containing protein [Methylocystis sp.]